ncbi:MAG: alpha/beta fold hydrolase, partial [Anaerolineae bacterium]
MKDTTPAIDFQSYKVNFVQQGRGQPVILIHGLAASLHDWDTLIPELVKNGFAAYALDLLGHGESGKPDSRAYQISWLFDHLAHWIDSLRLTAPPILIGHSLGGYLALEYARRFPSRTSSLVLVNPFFRLSQLPPLLRISYRHPTFNATVVKRTPEWLFRLIADATTLILDHSNIGLNTLPEHVRAQTTLDY